MDQMDYRTVFSPLYVISIANSPDVGFSLGKKIIAEVSGRRKLVKNQKHNVSEFRSELCQWFHLK